MSDTQIYIKYYDKNKEREDSEMIVCDRTVYKKYLGLYDDDSIIAKENRLQSCSLNAKYHAASFLKQIINFWIEKSGWESEYKKNEKLLDYIQKQTILEVDFNCY